MRIILTLALLALLAPTVVAQAFEATDGAPSYGNMAALYYGGPSKPSLGPTVTYEATRTLPVGGDLGDDGIVSMPLWDSWSSENTLEVEIYGDNIWLLLMVDADDDGTYSPNEVYEYSPFMVAQGGTVFGQGRRFTFEGIRIHATQDFTLNGHNKAAVRICVQNGVNGPMSGNPNGLFMGGEVEDWLIDVEPAKFAVATEVLEDATEGEAYAATVSPANGSGGYTWSLTSGALPQGLSVAQAGDDFNLTGTPAAGAGTGLQTYAFTVECASAGGAIASRNLELAVWPAPAGAPFADDFTNNLGWKLEGDWAITPAVHKHCGGDCYFHNIPATDPAYDHSPGTDGYVLADSPGAEIPWLAPREKCAVSPKINCTGLTNVELRYYRWFSVTSWHRYRLDVTHDGTNWTTVWRPAEEPGQSPLSLIAVADAGWTLFSHDISAIAAGHAQVQIRFVFEGTETAISPWASGGTLLDSDKFGGWNIDDVRVGAPIGEGGATLSTFEVQSPSVYAHASGDYMRAYPRFMHNWTANLVGGSEDITFTTAELAVQYERYPGQVSGFPSNVGINEVQANPTSFDGSIWTCTYPAVAQAGASITLQGTWYFDAAPAGLAGFPARLTMYLRGTTASGEPVEIRAEERVLWQDQPYPGLYVFEGTASGTVIKPGATASGLRNFGSVAPGATSGWLSIVVQNTSGGPFTLGVPALFGGAASEFDLDSSGFTTTLAAGSTTSFGVRFAPQTYGRRTARIEFTHNGPNVPSPFVIGISGWGVGSGPILGVYENTAGGTAVGSGSPAAGNRDFGFVSTSATSTPPAVLYIANTGNLDLVLGTPQVVGAGAAAFSLQLSQFSATIAPGGSTMIYVLFAPPGVGTFDAAVRWTHNDPGHGLDFTVNVTGMGVSYAPTIDVNENSPTGPAIYSGASAAGGRQFGVVQVSAAPTAWVDIFISNSGLQDLVLSAPTLSGSHAADFVLDTSGMSSTVQTLGSTSFRVAFDPRAKGLKGANIEIGHNDPTLSGPFTILLSGIGEDPLGVSVLTTSLPPGQVGESYGPYALAAQSGTAPYQWIFDGGVPPAGLTLNLDGTLAGTLTGNFGSYTFTVRVTDALGGDEYGVCSIVVSPPAGYIGSGKGRSSPAGCAQGARGGSLELLALMVLLCSLACKCSRTRRSSLQQATAQPSTS